MLHHYFFKSFCSLLLVFFTTCLQAQIITTVAGNHTQGYSGDGGPATNAEFYTPVGLTVDSTGNFYIADTDTCVIRKVNTAGIISTFAGNGSCGYSGDGGPAIDAELRLPISVGVDPSGNLYIADEANSVIRKVNTTGTISTVAGNGSFGYSGDGGPAIDAELYFPAGVTLDSSGNLYIADTGNCVIRKVNIAGIISTFAGNGTCGYSGDGGPAIDAELKFTPAAANLTVDTSGNLYIADNNNNVIRKVNTAGIISTVAGNGSPGYSGDGGPATAATLNGPEGLAVDNSGNLYIADTYNFVIRQVNTAGIISTVAGNHIYGYSGDGGLATNAQLSEINECALDPLNNLYIADSGNYVIRKVSAPVITNISPNAGPSVGGTSLTITGTGFVQVMQVFFGTTPASSFSVTSSTSLTAVSPAGTGTVDITVETSSATSAPTSADQFIYLAAPSITSVSPSSGPAAGGTSVTITGTGFTQVTQVLFGTTPASSFSVTSSTSLTAVSPAGTGTVDITVETSSATSAPTSADQFIYLAAPSITSVSPSSGPAAGGTSVTITGTGFTQITQVLFGTTPASSFSVTSPTSLTAVSPTGTGTVEITVVTANGTSNTSSYTYIFTPSHLVPSITSISPTSGPTRGGTIVTITGKNFTSAAKIFFGSVPALQVTVNSSTSLIATAPAGTGTVDVTVVTAGGTSALTTADRFTYILFPFPPSHLRAEQKKNVFATQTELINLLTWEPPSGGSRPVKYFIYKDKDLKHLIGAVAADKKLHFVDHHRKKNKTYSYFVVTIDAEGHVSRPASVVIKKR